MATTTLICCTFVALLLAAANAIKVPVNNDNSNNSLDAGNRPAVNTRQYSGQGGAAAACPLCDASVYSYCSYKVVHDSCCCDFPVAQLKPPQCFYYNCALLYAKSCYEHSLIKNCCCNNPY